MNRWVSSLVVLALSAWLAGCSGLNPAVEERPFFQPEYETGTHGRKSWLDRMVELDPGEVIVEVTPRYLEDPPRRIAVLPFTDEGTANLIVNKVPLTFRNRRERARWAWTTAQRLRRALTGFLAQREFSLVNLIAIDAVLADRDVTNRERLERISPIELGRWLDADAVVYGAVTHYEAYYFLLASAWQVGMRMHMISTRDGRTLIKAYGSRSKFSVGPATGVIDIALNSIGTLFQLRDVRLARSEEEVCREVVLRIPVSSTLRAELAREARQRARLSDSPSYEEESETD